MKRFILVGIAAASMCLFLAGCGPQLKHSTRTGKIHDIKVSDKLDPEQLQVHLGDEIRWINTRGANITVVFVDDLLDRLSCQKGFITGGFFKGLFSDNATVARITTIQPNEYASLCFATPGAYTYNARMDSTLPGSEKNLKGSIFVE